MTGSGVRESSGGLLLEVVVTPNAARSEAHGARPRGEALRVRVAAKAKRGAANAELVRFLAETLRVPTSAVRIVSGHAGRRKTIAVAGLTKEEFLARMEPGDA